MRDTLWNDFKMQVLRSGNTLNKLIAVNIVVFVLFGLLYVGLVISDTPGNLYDHIRYWFAMPSSLRSFIRQPWSIVTYQFMHEGFWHIAFNMLVFVFAGRIFREFLGDRKLLATYLMGGVAGAVVYAGAYNLLPHFHNEVAITTLMGASASIIAVLVAAATLVPGYTVHLILIGPVKLVYVALGFFLISVLSLAGGNAGGEFAHVCGALYGFLYIRLLQKGYDITSWLEKFFNWVNTIGKPRPSLKTHYVNERSKRPHRSDVEQEEIDRILDKISKSGYDSLSAAEKEVLFKASNQK
jgi:membrane associated rhomboid family serine protease